LTDAQIDFDPDTLRLTISGARKLPQASVVNGIRGDMVGMAVGASRVAGPVIDLKAGDALHVDPRLSS
jgi:hypothetical protein